MITLTKCRKVTIAFIATVLALAAGIFIGLGSRAPATDANQIVDIPSKAINDLFATRLPDAGGTQHTLADWRGKTLVINFWASWCQPCREEMPAFSRLQTRYARSDVQFVGIALDNAQNVAEFSSKLPVSYPLLIAEAEGSELMRKLGNSRQGLPYTVVLDRHGNTGLVRMGKLSEQQLEEFLQKNLALK